MVGHVRRSFHEILQQLTWLEDSTKKVAQEKVGTSKLYLYIAADSRHCFINLYFLRLSY